MKASSVIFLLLFHASVFCSQNLESISWEQISKHIEKNPDTLYIVNFWATWCKPCVQELPNLWAEAEKFKGKKIRFMPISLNFPDESELKVIPFIVKNFPQKKFYILSHMLSSNDINAIHPSWTGGIPFTTLYYNKKNYFIERKLKPGELEKEIRSIYSR